MTAIAYNTKVRAQVGVFLRISLLWRFGAVQQDERVRLNGVFKAANERLLLEMCIRDRPSASL